MCDYFDVENINEVETYSKFLRSELDTSPESLAAWHIEDPYNKRLTNKVKMELEVGEEFEFIIVLKSPSYNKKT